MHDQTLQSVGVLAYRLLCRDVQERHAGTVLGVFWLLVQPLFLLALYTLVFGGVLQMRFGAAASTTVFAFYLFTGLIVFNAFAEVMTRAPVILTERRDLLLNTPLPAWLLPVLPVASSILLEWLAVLILWIGMAFQGILQPWGMLLYLPFFVVRVILSLAAACCLSVLGVFLRDIRQMIPALLTVLMFISPILYPMEVVPERFRVWYDWNLLGQLVLGYRQALLEGTIAWGRWGALFLIAILLLLLSMALFRSLMPRARYVL